MNRALVTLTLLFAAAAALILIGGLRPPNNERGEQFQQLVGGLGDDPTAEPREESRLP